MSDRRGIAARVGWGVADQAFSSGTNFAAGIIVAHLLSPSQFGAFALAFSAYLVALSISRAVGSQPLAIRYSGSRPDKWRRATAAAQGAVLAVGFVASLICIGLAFVGGGGIIPAFAALALTLPGLLLQDGWRFALFASGRGGAAFLNDVVWAVALFPLLAVMYLRGQADAFTVVMCWGSAATVAALAGVWQTRTVPAPRAVRSWLGEHRDIVPPYAVGDVAYAASGQIAMFGIGAIAGLAVVGSLRAAQLLMGPINVLNQGVAIVALPEGARLLGKSLGDVQRAAIRLTAIAGTIGAAYATLVVAMPGSVGVALLGANWAGAQQVLVPVALQWVALSLQLGATVGLRVLAAAIRSLGVSALATSATIVGGIGGAWAGGLVGAAWGLCIAAWIPVAVGWWQFWLAVRAHHARMAAPVVQPHSIEQPPDRG